MTLKFSKIFYLIIPLLVLLIFLVDLFSFYSQVEIRVVAYFREFIIFSLLIFWYQVLKKKLHFDELSIEQNLLRLLLLVIANYLIYYGLKFLLHPRYSSGFPPYYTRPGDILVSTLLVIIATFTLVPSVLILKQLIFYKQKRHTAFFFNLFLFSTFLLAILAYFTEQPLDYWHFSRKTFVVNLATVLVLFSIIMLSFRNEWLTYLPRRKKLIYFLLGIFFLGFTGSLYQVVYRKPISAYSLTLHAIAYSTWLFLTIYSSFAFFKLFFYIPTARAFDRKIKEVNSLYNFGRLFSQEQDPERLIQIIVENTSEALESDLTWLQLYDREKRRFFVAGYRNLAEQDLTRNVLLHLNGLSQAIVHNKQAMLIHDVPHNRQFREIQRWRPDVQSIIGAPLFSNRGELMGIIYATKRKTYAFDIDDVSLLQGIANQASIAMENLRLLQESLERERLEHELKIARDVQLRLLPQSIPQIPDFRIEASCLSAYEVGGDYYDFFTFQDGNPGIVIGDVSGKGASAALYMAEFKGIIQSLAHYHRSPASLAKAVNRILYPNIERKAFVSAIILKLEPAAHRISFVRAGHTPLLYRAQAEAPVEALTPGGIGFGLNADRLFDSLLEETFLPMEEGSLVLIYTDGLTEARNPAGEEFGEERLLRLLEGNLHSVPEIHHQIMEEVLRFCGETPLHDDLTFVLIGCC